MSVELDTVTSEDWQQLVGDESRAWGGGEGESFTWGDKQRHVTRRDAGGTLLAVAGATVREVEVEGAARFDVFGIGGVFVRRDRRGQGLARALVGELLELAREQDGGPQRAMLFCEADRMGLYGKFGFQEIASPVWADQPGGRIEMPMHSMWLPLDPGAGWPSGRVDVLGLPF